jgi:hypothetical protein
MKIYSTLKKGAFIFGVVLGLTGCATTQQTNDNWQQTGYNEQSARIFERVKAKEINIQEANTQMIAVARSFFPDDRLLIGVWEDLAEMAKSYVAGDLTMDKYNEMVNMRWEIFDAANLARHQARDAQLAQARRDTFMQNFLTSMGRSMERSYPQPINCTSTVLHNQVMTNCR